MDTNENNQTQDIIIVPLDKRIPKYAKDHGLSIGRVNSVTNMFVEGVHLGGAGGIANTQIQCDTDGFIRELEANPGLNLIRYTDEDDMGDLERTYYALSSDNKGLVVITHQTYEPPEPADFESATLEEATFRRTGIIGPIIALCVLIGLLYLLWTMLF